MSSLASPESENKQDNQAVATPSIPQEIQCAVFLTIKSLIRSGASLSHHNTCAHRLVSQPQQQEAHLTYTTGFLSYGSIRSNYLYLIKHSSVQQQKKKLLAQW